MIGGLSEKDFKIIISSLECHSDIQQALLFGSRSMGTYRNGSDIDIALKGKNLQRIVTKLSGYLNDEAPLPYHFDVLDFEGITNNSLRDHINRVGIIIYEREKS